MNSKNNPKNTKENRFTEHEHFSEDMEFQLAPE